TYDNGEYLVLVTTVDRVINSIPFKGQVLNQTSLWWFERTQHITANAVVSTPDPNVIIARNKLFVDTLLRLFVARGFVTGKIDTSLWTVYNKGIQNYCGNVLPLLVENIFTPTTKVADHDVPVLPDKVLFL
ncbi:hypothetical protein HN51_063573, partial [Arachis hypogaea]